MSRDLTEDAKREAITAAPVRGVRRDGDRIGGRRKGDAITLQIRPAAEASPSSFATPKR